MNIPKRSSVHQAMRDPFCAEDSSKRRFVCAWSDRAPRDTINRAYTFLIQLALVVWPNITLCLGMLFRSKGINRIVDCGPDCLETDGNDSDGDRRQAGGRENPGADADTVGEIGQPVGHKPPGDG